MGIGVDDMDYPNYDADMHVEIDETALDDDPNNTLRMRNPSRNRTGRSKGSLRHCAVHDPHQTLLSNPHLPETDLEAGSVPNRRHTMVNHIGSMFSGSRKDLQPNGHSDDMKPRIAQPKQRSCFGGRIRVPSSRAKKIDFFSRILFPCMSNSFRNLV